MILNMAISSVFTEVGLQLWMKFRIGVEKMIVGTNILEDKVIYSLEIFGIYQVVFVWAQEGLPQMFDD